MTDEYTAETDADGTHDRIAHGTNWTRLEGVVAVGALLASFLWFLGMPTGLAIGVGFGVVLLLDFLRSLIFDEARAELAAHELPSE